MGGHVVVKERTLIGIGAKVIQGLTINSNCIVGAGSVVVDNLNSDVKEIIYASNEIAGDRNDIAASHVVWGLAKKLNELSLKDWRLWEIDE